MVVTDNLGAVLHSPTKGSNYAFIHASAVRSYRGDRDSCVLCSVPSRSLSVARPTISKRKAAQRVRPKLSSFVQSHCARPKHTCDQTAKDDVIGNVHSVVPTTVPR